MFQDTVLQFQINDPTPIPKISCIYSAIIQTPMGKRAGKFKPSNSGHKKVKQQWSNIDILTQNELFRAYYQLQLPMPSDQFDIFWATMKQKLPVVFRVNPSCPNYLAFLNKIRQPDLLQQIIPSQDLPNELPKLDPIHWYPNALVYTLNTTKQQFKKSQTLANFHKYLQKAFDSGLIARQELVSMLPPLYLDIQPSDIVLDICAAPGSKTSQLLEMIYGLDRTLGKGCVIANDADYSRAQMLIHQLNRAGTSGMAVINHPGQFLPQLLLPRTESSKTFKQKFLFDKVLCDVPCSGDGATRKIPIKWAKWHTSDGQALHPLQLAILMKSVNLLKRGGLLVYSTCSLNPIQNEAVVSALFAKVNRGLEIIDIHPMYQVKGRRGLLQWHVCGIEHHIEKVEINGTVTEIKKRLLKIYPNYQQAKHLYKIKESMFPPPQEEAIEIGLHNTMRILPHDQNSGGFFVALLRKNQDFEWKYESGKNDNNPNKNLSKEEEQVLKQQMDNQFVQKNLPQVDPIGNEPLLDNGEDQNSQAELINQVNQENLHQEQPQKQVDLQAENQHQQNQNQLRKGLQGKQQGIDQSHQRVELTMAMHPKRQRGPMYQKFYVLAPSQFEILQSFYGLSEQLNPYFYIRDAGKIGRNVLLISQGVKNFLSADTDGKIKLVNMGCKVFEKVKQSFAGHECLYRLSQQGIHFLLPHLTKRKVQVSLPFFKSIIQSNQVQHEEIIQVKTRQAVRNITQGSFCLYIDEQIEGIRVKDAVVGQNFKNSFHLMVGKQEMASLVLRYL